MPFSAGDVGLVRTVWEASVVTTARFRWDAGGPLQTLRTGRTSPAREPPLFAERGFANIDQATSELWLLGQSPLASRFVPLDARGLLARVVHQAKDGRWLVAMGGTAQVQLVVAGDGGLAASAPGAAGLRCDPLLSE